MPNMTFVQVDIRHRMAQLLNFQVQTLQLAILTQLRLEKANVTIANKQEVRYLPLNGATATVVHHDFDLNLKVTKFENVNIWKTVRASEKFKRDVYRG